ETDDPRAEEDIRPDRLFTVQRSAANRRRACNCRGLCGHGAGRAARGTNTCAAYRITCATSDAWLVHDRPDLLGCVLGELVDIQLAEGDLEELIDQHRLDF